MRKIWNRIVFACVCLFSLSLLMSNTKAKETEYDASIAVTRNQGADEEIIINNYDGESNSFLSFVEESKSNTFSGKTISITMEEVMVLDSRFTGIGDDDTAFAGNLKFNTIAVSYSTTDVTDSCFFNNLSSSATFSGNNLEMNVNVGKPLANKLTVVSGSTLDLSHFRYTNGTSVNVNGSGIVANTLTGSGTLHVSFGGMLSGISVAFSNTTYAGLVTGTLPAGITLSITNPNNVTLNGSSSISIGGYVGLAEGDITVSGTNQITINSANNAGGICAVLQGTITATGTINASIQSANNVGGIAATTSNTSSITANSLILSGSKSGSQYVGGVVGDNDTDLELNGITIEGSISGHVVGGLIGRSNTNSSITGSSAATINCGSIQNSGDNSIVGGVIGDASAGSNHLSVNFNNPYMNIQGNNYTGGVYGLFTDQDTDLLSPTFVFSKIYIGGSNYVGGYIGKAVIKNDFTMSNANLTINMDSYYIGSADKIGVFIGYLDASADFTFNISKAITSSKFGLFGYVLSRARANDIVINGNNYEFTATSLSTSQGIIVSKIAEGSYVKLMNINATASDSNVAMIKTVEKNAMVEIGKSTYYNESSGSIYVDTAGDGSIVYLNGPFVTGKYLHVVKTIAKSLVYANMSNFTLTTGTKAGWDVGSYGGIIKDRVDAGTPFITFDESTNKISLKPLSVTSKSVNLTSVEDAVVFAISLQTNVNYSAFGSMSSSDVRSLNVKLTNDIDLTGTGIESFSYPISNSGSYEFKGSFDGNNHTITLFIGKDFNGNERVRTYTESINYFGLFNRVSNVTISNLTINGTINGAAAPTLTGGTFVAYADGVTLVNCKSNVNITLSCTKNNYIGSFIGQSYGAVTLTDCTAGTSENPVLITVTGEALVGGVIGQYNNSNLTISKTTSGNEFYCNLAAPGNCGGLIAQINNGKDITLTGITANLQVNGKWNCGGIVAAFEQNTSSTNISIQNNTFTTYVHHVEAGSNAGGLVGAITDGTIGTLNINQNIITTTINTTGNSGGVLGIVNKNAQVTSLSITNNTIDANIEKTGGDSGFLMGSYKESNSTTFNLSGNTVKTTSIINSTNTTGRVGGFVATLSFTSLKEVNITGTVINGTIKTNSCSTTNYAGGLLGYEWKNTNVRLTGTHNVSNSSKGINAGICAIYEGILVLESEFTNSGSLSTTSSSTSGIVSVYQVNAMIFVLAAYNQLAGSMTGTRELSVFTEASTGLTTQGGLLSVELSGALGSMKNASGTLVTADTVWGTYFTNILNKKNSKVRYYFNTYNYFYAGTTPQKKSSTTITSSSDLVYWHLRDYLFDNDGLSDDIKNLFYSGNVNNITTSGALNLDMTDYCFYPTKKLSSTMDFKNSTVTFGLSNSTMKSKSMESDSQFYGLQYGFILGTVATATDTSVVSISNIILKGEFGSDDTYSGVFILDSFSGYHSATVNVTSTLTLSNITLYGIKNLDTDNSLLIRNIGQELNMTVEGIYAYSNTNDEAYTGKCYYSGTAASSLFGTAGFSGAVDLKITLTSIAVDSTMFTKALFFDSLIYGAGGKATYNFSEEEDYAGSTHIKKVTYGKEIDFEDQDCYLNSEVYVNPTHANEDYDFSAYLYYCGTSSQEDYKFLLYVNRKKSNLDVGNGFGTYTYPYQINVAGQLVVIADIISSGEIPEGFIINFPNSVSAPTAYTTYTYVNDKFEDSLGNVNSSITIAAVRSWLQGAYYSIEALNDGNIIDLTAKKYESFIGIGTIYYPFHGVIVGKTKNSTAPIIKMPETIKVETAGYSAETSGVGFINVSNGCALYNINLTYKNITYSDVSNVYPAKETNFLSPSPTSSTIGTDYYYFGGAIGLQIGGDSTLDKVSVSYTGTTLTSNNPTSIFGGLIGFVNFGGVTFGGDNDVDINYSLANSHVYFNTYVGKVMNAYVIEVGTTTGYVNTNLKDSSYIGYQIASVSNPTGQIAVVRSGTNVTVTLDNREKLFIFAIFTNSGYFAGTKVYVPDAVRSRYGSYSGVGTSTNVTDGLYTQDTYTSSSKPFIFSYLSAAINTSNDDVYINLASNLTYDLSIYKNAYRGIGGLIGTGANPANSYAGIMWIKVVNGNNATIQFGVDYRQFANGGTGEIDHLQAFGFITYTDHSPTVKNLNITGNLIVRYFNASGEVIRGRYGQVYVGGVVGKTNYMWFENVTIKNAYIEGPSYVGGLTGEYSVEAYSRYVKNCKVEDSIIASNTYIGGFFGMASARADLPISNCSLTNSLFVLTNYGQTSSAHVGGFVGLTGGNSSGNINFTNASITNCDIMINATVSGTCYAGGFIGFNEKTKMTVTDSTVESTNVTAIGDQMTQTLADKTTALIDKTKVSTVIQQGYVALTKNLSQGTKDCNSGSIIGRNQQNVTLTNVTVTSNTREVYLLSYNNSAGLIGDTKGNGLVINISNCSVLATKNNIYISGIPRSAGVMGYIECDNATGAVTLSNVKVEGDQTVDGVKQNKNIIMTSVYNQDLKTNCGGLIAGGKYRPVSIIDCSVKNCVILSRYSSASIAYQLDGTLSVEGLVVDSCYIYGTVGSSIFISAESSQMTLENVHVTNTTVCGGTSTKGGIIAGGDFNANVTGYNFMLHNIGVGQATIDFTGVTATSKTDYAKIIAIVQTGGISSLQSKTTLSTGNFGYLVYSNSGQIRLYNIVRSEKDSTTALPSGMKKFGTGVTNGVGVIIDYGIYDGTAGSFGAYSAFAAEGFDMSKLANIIENYGYISDTEDGKVLGEQNALTGIEAKPLTSKYLNDSSVSDFSLSSDKLEPKQFKDIDNLTFTTETYKNAGILGVQSDIASINVDIIEYLDLITFGGFSEQYNKYRSGISIESYRYHYVNGVVSKYEGHTGSIIYNGTSFTFNSNENGGYDLLSGGDDLTFTILYITLSYDSFSYTFTLALYYEQILEMDSHVVPMVGENYLISSYLTSKNNVQLDPTEYLSLYIEYAYSDVAERIPFNFDKKLVSVTNYGLTGGTMIPAGTKFKLVDISSSSPSGYKVYYYVLENASREINLSAFEATSALEYIPLSTLSEFNKVSTNENYVYIERYILIVEFPSDAITTQLSYFLVADETSKNNVRIEHEKGDNFSSYTRNVKVLSSPSADLEASYTSDPELKETFSNLSDDPIDTVISGEITVPYDYYALAVGNKHLYGVYKFTLIDADHNAVVLPENTELVIEAGGTQYTKDVSNLATITYSLGDILTKVSKKSDGDDYALNQSITVKLDFGKCSTYDFNSVFIQRALYTLSTEFYLCVDENQYNTGRQYTLDSLTYTANLVADIKVNMIAEDSRYLGINVSSVEKDDATNNGIIDYNLVVDFSMINDESIPDEATLTFTLYRKELVEGEYKYVQYNKNLPSGIVNSLGDVYYGDTKLTDNAITLSVNTAEKKIEGKFTYKVDFPMDGEDVDTSKLLLTSYKLAVKVTYDGASGAQSDYDSFLIFLIVDINTN